MYVFAIFYRHVIDIKHVQTAASLQQPPRRRFMNAMKATIVAKEAQSPNQFKCCMPDSFIEQPAK